MTTIRYCRSRGFDRPEETLAEADALARRQYYRVHVDGGRVDRAEQIHEGAVVRVVYVRDHAADDALRAAHRAGYGAVAFDVESSVRIEGAHRTQIRRTYDGQGQPRRFAETTTDARGNVVREVLGITGPESIIEYEHNENHVLLRSTHKLLDGTVTEVYDWLADARLGMA